MRLPLFNRRTVIAAAGIGAAMPFLASCGAAPAEAKSFPKAKSEAEWRRVLTKDQFHVLRQGGTERAFTSPIDKEKRTGTFVCAGCGNALYASAHKYDSRTGWPSFWQAIDKGRWAPAPITRSAFPAPKCTAPIAAGIWGIFSETGQNPLENATASTGWR